MSVENCKQSLLHIDVHQGAGYYLLTARRKRKHDSILVIVESSNISAPDLKGLFDISIEPVTLRSEIFRWTLAK